ncbi:hypothetical protein K3N28_09005 [Glycomyces sp. TRM65418]|uniref:vWA domain-containing protein n=1 Tax=Glycomyces sp. TRM65418 TaxID=2867006 RepID=UPI001CE57DAC|nr:hypothetical protein [Glycomyces sp. TRM65418]MCC3763207.1 hypothetical protein [Glycomyces sp. TRM65418]QZD57211.1 hypothetical protein K3N28_08945 [Glycomyces sp. TRM65418]
MVFGTEHKVRSHRLGRRRKKGGSRMPVAPWIVITMVCVLVAAGLTWGFVTLLRSGCSGMYRVTVAVAPGVFSTLEDAAQAWEAEGPEVDGQCVGIDVREVAPDDASRGIMGDWNPKSLGPRPIAWVPDSQAWASWVASSEMTAGYASSDPVVLGQAAPVLAVAESKATELGWIGGQPPSWADVLGAAREGRISLAAANPRTSTEGLVAMLNATSDGAGGFSQEALDAYSAAADAGSVTDDADEQLALYAESGDTSRVVTALDYQVEDFNADTAPADPLVPITPSGTSVGAVATYLVLGGAGWVSESDAGIARRFGEHLRSQVESGAFADAELQAVEDPQAALAQTTPATVGEAVKSWRVGRQDLNVLFLVDRSSVIAGESVEYDGEAVSAGDAAIRTAVATVNAMESTSRAGLWEYGVGADGDANWRGVTDIEELTDDHREGLVGDLYAISENDPYEGGSPLYDSLVAAYQYMGEHAVDGAANVVVVLTNSGEDTVSAPSAEEAAGTLAGMDGAVTVYTVGLGSANSANLTLLAEATGGAHVPAPAAGGVLEAIGG